MTLKDIQHIAVSAALLAVIGYHAAPDQAHAHRPAPVVPTRIDGTVREIALTVPHPELDIEDAEGRHWTVWLGSPDRIAAAGLTPASVSPGDPAEVVARSAGGALRALHLTVAGADYDLSPR